MKKQIHITVDADCLSEARRYAEAHNTSISRLVEAHLNQLKAAGKPLTAIIRSLKPKGNYTGRNLIEEYYEEKGRQPKGSSTL